MINYYPVRRRSFFDPPMRSWHAVLICLFVLFLALIGIVRDIYGQAPILPPGDLAAIKRILPAIENAKLNKILQDPTMNWYDLKTMPPAFQFQPGNGYLPTYFYHANNNFSGDPSDAPLGNGRGGNANCEFPWNQTPGGGHRSPFIDSFKGMWLPKKANGRPYPVVWFRDALPGRGGGGSLVPRLPFGRRDRNGFLIHRNYENGYRWCFPVGTVFVEALTTRDSKGYTYVFEIRFRIREFDEWQIDLFRPYPTAKGYAKALKSTFPKWKSDSNLSSAIKHLEADISMKQVTLVDSRHRTKNAFNVKSGFDDIPNIGNGAEHERRVNLMLTKTVFKTAHGEVWRQGTNSLDCYAPTNTRREHNIFPHGYDGTFVGSDAQSCMKCHEGANQHATVFEVPRGWYGRVRGSDGILSWHPIAPSSVQSFGSAARAVRFRQLYVNQGIIEKYQKGYHSAKIWNSIEGLW